MASGASPGRFSRMNGLKKGYESRLHKHIFTGKGSHGNCLNRLPLIFSTMTLLNPAGTETINALEGLFRAGSHIPPSQSKAWVHLTKRSRVSMLNEFYLLISTEIKINY